MSQKKKKKKKKLSTSKILSFALRMIHLKRRKLPFRSSWAISLPPIQGN